MPDVSFIMSQSECRDITCFKIKSPMPDNGYVLSANSVPRACSLTMEGGAGSEWGGASGQGLQYQRAFDRAGTDPTLIGEDLSNCFLVSEPGNLKIVERDCSFFFEITGILPFLCAPRLQDRGIPEENLRYANTPLQQHTWFPVELSLPEVDDEPHKLATESAILAYGVLKITSAASLSQATGAVRFLATPEFLAKLGSKVQLSRFGRRVGHCTFFDRIAL